MNYTPEQLEAVAGWLGERHLKRDDNADWESHYPEGNGWQTRWRSDADLFAAIDDKAVAEGLDPDLLTMANDPSTREYRLYPPDLRGGQLSIWARGPDRLSAAINAVLKLIESK